MSGISSLSSKEKPWWGGRRKERITMGNGPSAAGLRNRYRGGGGRTPLGGVRANFKFLGEDP